MVRESQRVKKTAAFIMAAGVSLAALTACSTGNEESGVGSENSDMNNSSVGQGSEGKNSEQLGDPAQPVASPKVADNVPGKVTTGRNDHDAVMDTSYVSLDGKEPAIATLSKGTLRIGAIDKLTGKKPDAKSIKVPESCKSISPSERGVVIACENAATEYNADGKKLVSVKLPGKVKAATILKNKQIVASFSDDDRLRFFDMAEHADGDTDVAAEENDKVIVSRSIDDLLHFTSADGGEQLAAIDRGQTSITDVQPDDHELKGALRIGQGVGQTSTGRGTDGIVIASDARQDQFQLFTMHDVVRQHQSAPTSAGPWSVLWDAKRSIAWVSTTKDNMLTGYKVDEGTPIKVAELATIADVRHIMDSPSGELLLMSAKSSTQLLSTSDIDRAIDRGVPGVEDFPVWRQD